MTDDELGGGPAPAGSTTQADSTIAEDLGGLHVEGGQHVWTVFRDRTEFDGGASFGFGQAAPARGRITGPLLDAEVEEVLVRYVAPKAHERAREALATQRIVLLHGPDGIGKRSGALRLLDDVGVERPIVALSPALSLDELVKYKFRKDRGYLLQDWLGDTGRSESIAFAVQTLRAELASKGAWLVITSGRELRNAALREVGVRWSAPDPMHVLDVQLSHAEIGLDAAQRAALEAHFADCAAPGIIAELVARLAEASDDVRIEDLLEDTRQDEVATCFDDEPDVEWVVFVAALAFVYDLPLTTFERALADLETVLWPEPETAGDDEDERETTRRAHSLEPRRARHASRPLVKLQQTGGDSFGSRSEPRLTFTSGNHRARVIEELWARYDHRLWDAIETWLDDLVAGADDDLQLSVALGLALFYRTAPEPVRLRFFEPWASASDDRRFVVAYAMWWLALDDATAAPALAIVIEWSRRGDARRRVTAILALSGALGARFPGDALRWLWHLARRKDFVGDLAKVAIGDLARACGESDVPDPSVLSFLTNKLRKAQAARNGRPEETLVLQVLEKVMAIKDGRQPAIAGVLERSPATVTLLGPLMAESLVVRPFRGAAIEALGKVLRALDRARRRDVITHLGQSIVAAMPSHEVALLERDLFAELDIGDSKSRDLARTIVEAMLEPPLALPDLEDPKEP